MPIPLFHKYAEENPMEYTAKMIAFAVLLVFAIGLIGAGLVSVFNNENNTEWFNLFKDGFLILSGAIATIIGYYFGSKNRAIQESNQRIQAESTRVDNEMLDEFVPKEPEFQPPPSSPDVRSEVGPGIEGMKTAFSLEDL